MKIRICEAFVFCAPSASGQAFGPYIEPNPGLECFAPKGLEATILGLRPLFCARRGYGSQPRVSTRGIVPQERRALKGAPDRTSQQGGNGASFIRYPHLSPLQGEPFIFEGSQGGNPGLTSVAPSGQASRSIYRANPGLGCFAPKGLEATILGLRPLFCAPKGLRISAQGFNPWNRPPRATRPEGGARSNVPTRRKRCKLHQVPASLALSGRTVYFEGPGLKPWADFCSPCGAGLSVHI